MAVFPGTYIEKDQASTTKMNHLIDDLLTPQIISFRQVFMHDEQATLDYDETNWRVTYGNILENAPLRVRKNGAPFTSVTNIDYTNGTFQAGIPDVGADSRARDVILVDYAWDYFPVEVLEAYMTMAVSIINMTAVGPPTSYTVTSAPTEWEGIIVALALAKCMEKLLLDYTLWRYRLIYAIGPDGVYQGGGDIVGMIETLKSNAEEIANNAMQNEKFKVGNYLSKPTGIYYDAVHAGGIGAGHHGIHTTGKLRGLHINHIFT